MQTSGHQQWVKVTFSRPWKENEIAEAFKRIHETLKISMPMSETHLWVVSMDVLLPKSEENPMGLEALARFMSQPRVLPIDLKRQLNALMSLEAADKIVLIVAQSKDNHRKGPPVEETKDLVFRLGLGMVMADSVEVRDDMIRQIADAYSALEGNE